MNFKMYNRKVLLKIWKCSINGNYKNDKKSDKSSGKTVKSDKAEDTAGAVSTQNADAGTKTEEV